MTASLKVTGFKELDQVLAEMPRALAGQAVSAGMRRALEPVAAAARSYAAGSLSDRIRIAPKIKASQFAESIVKDIRNRRLMFVGSGAPHAHLVEFGTGPRYHKSGKYVGIMPPDPFLRPAWDANKDRVLAILAEAIKEEIARAIKRRVAKASFIGPVRPRASRRNA